MIGALWTGISGLSSQQKALDNESNNIANVNTVGYKASRLSFADQMYQDRIGKGSKVLDAEKLYTQGNLKLTGVAYDMALSGDGFFEVSGTRTSGNTESLYTRAGNFRMGDNGTLQDSAGNEVQGWAISDIDPKSDVVSTNPNVSVFDENYNKLISSDIIRNTNNITTITAKATDYNKSAKADSETVFSGYGLKSQSAKISDIEALISNYSKWSDKVKADPNEKSASSISQISGIDLADATDPASIQSEGDLVYVYIDGNKISQTFDTDYNTTMQKFADKISEVQGLKAYVSDTAFNKTTGSIADGSIRIESLIPGQIFDITEVAMTTSNVTTQGNISTLTNAQEGIGIGALNSAREALEKVISGKQYDVYDTATLNINAGVSDYDFNLDIYDNSLERTVSLPTLSMTNVNDIDDMVATINGSASHSAHIEAENVNGNLVIKTKDSNFDVEFNSSFIDTTTGANPVLERNQDYSGREGANAEFIEITTKIDQTSTKDSLQLRLDTLEISDNAFGEFSVDSTGLITMKQDGADFAIGQVAIAVFNNNRGLNPVGDNLVSKTSESGEPIFSVNNEKTAKIEGQTLELSTADLSESLVNLMVFQRAFEANAKSITTSDELLKTLINLKR